MVRKRMPWIWCVVVLAAVCGTATLLVKKAWGDSDDIPSLQEAVENDQGFEGTDEYDPAGEDHTNLPQKPPRLRILPPEQPEAVSPRAWRVTASQAETPVERR